MVMNSLPRFCAWGTPAIMVRRLVRLIVYFAVLCGALWLAWLNGPAFVAHVQARPLAWLAGLALLLAVSVVTAVTLAARGRARDRALADAMRVAEASLKRQPPAPARPEMAQAEVPDTDAGQAIGAAAPARGTPSLSVIEGGRSGEARAEASLGPLPADREHLSHSLYFEPICNLSTGAVCGFDVVHKVRPSSESAQPRFVRNLPRSSTADRSQFEIRTIEQALAAGRQAMAGAGVLGPGDRLHVHASEALLDNAGAVRRVIALFAAHPALTAHFALCFEGEVLAGREPGRIDALERLADTGLVIGASTSAFKPSRLVPAVAGALSLVFFKPDEAGGHGEDEPPAGTLEDVIDWCAGAGIALIARGLSSEAAIVDAIAMGAKTGCGPALARPVKLRASKAARTAGTAALS